MNNECAWENKIYIMILYFKMLEKLTRIQAYFDVTQYESFLNESVMFMAFR